MVLHQAIIQLPHRANSLAGVPPWSSPILPCHFCPFSCIHIPLWFAFNAQHIWSLFFPFLEDWPQAIGAILPIVMKSHRCPNMGSPWPKIVWARLWNLSTLVQDSPEVWLTPEVPMGSGEAPYPHTSLPDFIPGLCLPHSFTPLPGSMF